MSTAYDDVAYPARVFPVTHPEHLATIARLHGLAAPAPETARVLEIGGGDGVNLLAIGAAYPATLGLSIDLSAAAVARGTALGRSAGVGNVRLEVHDIVAAADTLDGCFDYVIAHGVYAWVPAPVRDALLRLAARVLAPDGVVFISYNAMPGGHMRRMLRDMALHHIAGIDGNAERLAAARAYLADLGAPREHDRIVVQAMREIARPMAVKTAEALFHDELGGVFEPQSLTDVTTAAAAHGLAFLNDASPLLFGDGLPGEALDDAAVVRRAQASDYAVMTFFHQTLLVRAGRAPARIAVLDAIPDLFLACHVKRVGPEAFEVADNSFTVEDAVLADVLEAVSKVWPRRARVATLVGAGDTDRLEALYRLFAAGVVSLSACQLPGVFSPGERPLASPLALAQLALGRTSLLSLDHREIEFEAPGPRRFLALLDGTRDRAAIAADWAASGHADEIEAEVALAQLARVGMIMR